MMRSDCLMSFSVAALVLLVLVSSESVSGACDDCKRSVLAEDVRMELPA